MRLYAWKINAHMIFSMVGKPRLGNVLPIEGYLAAAGAVQAADQESRVVLPQPEGPRMA